MERIINRGDLDALIKYLEPVEDVNNYFEHDYAAIHSIGYAAQPKLLHWVLTVRGADPNLRCRRYMAYPPLRTLLFNGAHSTNHIECARMLLEAGADPNAEFDNTTIARHVRHNVQFTRRWEPVYWLLLEYGMRNQEEPVHPLLTRRRNASRAAVIVYACIKHMRYGRDVASLVARHVWRTRVCNEWQRDVYF